MAGKPADPATVPECKVRFMTTRPMKKTKDGFVGFETIWEPFQKVAEYKTPERP